MRQRGVAIHCGRRLSAAVILAAGLLLGGCRGWVDVGPLTEDLEEAVRHDLAAMEPASARAEAAAQALATRLQGHLAEAMAAGGAEMAIDVCATVAQDLTREIGREQGVEIRRTAMRVRNPRNRPDAFERAVLEEWLAASEPPLARGVILERVGGSSDEPAREFRYLRPIVLAELCVACHGPAEGLDAPIRAAIAEHYPADEATGFRPGELRGAISVRVPLGPG